MSPSDSGRRVDADIQSPSGFPYIFSSLFQYFPSSAIDDSARSEFAEERTGLRNALANDQRPLCRRMARTMDGGFCAAILFCFPVGIAATEALRKAATAVL